MSVICTLVNYSDPKQANELIELLDNYAKDPMGGGAQLKDNSRQHLVKELAKLDHAFSIIAYFDGEAVGLANCFVGFSTFKCQPLVNIHDLAVNTQFRGRGIGKQLLQKIEDVAREKNCCKITLEVLEGNKGAQHAYINSGFAGYELDPAMGRAMFWEKSLS